MNEKKSRIMEWWNGGVQQVVACTVFYPGADVF